jgi:dTDP-4-amino-4,6-dideoxygalactose transaminase
MPGLVRFMDLSVDAAARQKYLAAIDAVLTSGLLVNGPEVARFERQVADYCGALDAVGVGSGTAALYLALKCLDIGPGDEVILPALSFVGTANAVAAVGAHPVFVDIGPDLLIDPAAVEPAITSRTRAIMPVHFTGNVCDMDALLAISEEQSIPILEDAAPAFGAVYRDRKAGTFGPLGCFSANPMKVLAGIGEAGFVIVQSAPHAARLRELRYHGMRNKELCTEVSLNERLDTIQAAILSARLEAIEKNLSRREAIARRYAMHLSNIVETPKVRPCVRHAWYHYPILCDRRDELGAALAAENIESRVYHPKLMSDHPVHAHEAERFPVGRRAVDRILCLPMHERLQDEDVDRVSEVIARFYAKS